ncbi:MAG: cytochrome c maturation protein CcmE [Thermoleophilaceae bacterium]
MNPARRRRVRFVVALAAAVLLAGALAYASFSASSAAKTPSQLLRVDGARSYQLTGMVAKGSVSRHGSTLAFRVRDRAGSASVPVRYAGAVPEPFREGREVIVTVRRRGAVFVGERDSLVTKCPSKFATKRPT